MMEIDFVVYDPDTEQVIEQCLGCQLELPFKTDACLQCGHKRISYEAVYDGSKQTIRDEKNGNTTN